MVTSASTGGRPRQSVPGPWNAPMAHRQHSSVVTRQLESGRQHAPRLTKQPVQSPMSVTVSSVRNSPPVPTNVPSKYTL